VRVLTTCVMLSMSRALVACRQTSVRGAGTRLGPFAPPHKAERIMASLPTNYGRCGYEGPAWVLPCVVSRSKSLAVLVARMIACTFPQSGERNFLWAIVEEIRTEARHWASVCDLALTYSGVAALSAQRISACARSRCDLSSLAELRCARSCGGQPRANCPQCDLIGAEDCDHRSPSGARSCFSKKVRSGSLCRERCTRTAPTSSRFLMTPLRGNLAGA
jgi:hypothetical protein